MQCYRNNKLETKWVEKFQLLETCLHKQNDYSDETILENKWVQKFYEVLITTASHMARALLWSLLFHNHTKHAIIPSHYSNFPKFLHSL